MHLIKCLSKLTSFVQCLSTHHISSYKMIFGIVPEKLTTNCHDLILGDYSDLTILVILDFRAIHYCKLK